MRFGTLLVGGALILSAVAATQYLDEPLSPQELAHQRVHEHKNRDMAEAARANALAGIVPPTRLSDVPCVDGEAGPFECDGIDLLGFVPWSELDTTDQRAVTDTELTDIWGWTDPETDDEYIIFGETSGVGFMRVTDPLDPVYLGELPSKAIAQLHWHDIKVYDDHAFIVSEAAPHGMTLFDLTKLRDAEGPEEWVEDGFYPLPMSAHNIAINEDTGYAYIVGGNGGLVVPDQCASGLHIVDISDPTLPMFAGCYIGDEGPGTAAGLVGGAVADNSPVGYIHDTQCVVYRGPDEEHHDKEVCFNSSEDKFSIVDVTDKLNPVRLGVLEYENTAYTHQGWLTEDQAFFLLGDELDEQDFGLNTRTLLFDVSDLDEPTLAGDGEHVHDTTSIDHNMYTKDGLVYQSNYTTGLRVLDTDHIAEGELETVAWFDTFPLHDNPVFAGTWSNYPYFESGTIAVTSGVEGVFLLRVQEEVLTDHADAAD